MNGIYGVALYTDTPENLGFNYFGESPVDDFEVDIDINLTYTNEYYLEI